MFLLRYRDPARYGRWRDQMRVDVPPDGVARHLHELIASVDGDAACESVGAPNVPWVPAPPQLVSEARPRLDRSWR